jgi:hypothetical protein
LKTKRVDINAQLARGGDLVEGVKTSPIQITTNPAPSRDPL